MISHKDYSVNQTWDDVLRHRVRLPGYFNAWAAKYLYDRAPSEFDAEQAGTDGNGQAIYVLFWHAPAAS